MQPRRLRHATAAFSRYSVSIASTPDSLLISASTGARRRRAHRMCAWRRGARRWRSGGLLHGVREEGRADRRKVLAAQRCGRRFVPHTPMTVSMRRSLGFGLANHRVRRSSIARRYGPRRHRRWRDDRLDRRAGTWRGGFGDAAERTAE